jgi:hypothetical protein
MVRLQHFGTGLTSSPLSRAWLDLGDIFQPIDYY